jgi:saccharopine dehydrogenase-like NADP-dependent oxidoreductase
MNSKNVLVLGAGMMSPPLLRYMLGRTPHRVLVAALDVSRAQTVLEDFPRGRVQQIDVTDVKAVAPLVCEADAVVSLLPADLTPGIARLAIDCRIPLVNTSYVSPALRELDGAARSAGVLLLAEMGLDPGYDHMTAIREIRRVHARGGHVTQMLSSAGGLPAPECNNNPWGYKFSWFPRAVMMAARQPARFLRRGQTVEIPGPQLFDRHWPFAVEGLGVLELYPNRDALAYLEPYGLKKIEGFFRGSLRYPGWCETLRAASRLGLLDLEPIDWPEGTTYADVATRLLPRKGGPLIARLSELLGAEPDAGLLARFEWAGLLSDRRIPERRAASLDVFVNRLQRLASYAPGERDMVALEHRVTATFPDGHTEDVAASLLAFGDPFGDSAMARTVALPAAVATRLILDGAVEAKGVQIPVLPELYRPIMTELEELGLSFRERRASHYPGPLA